MTIERIGKTNLYVGNGNDSRDIFHLRKLGICSVVNVAKDLEGPWFHGDFRNYKVSLLDGPGNNLYQYILAIQVVMTLLKNGEKVLLHCVGGMSRSPAIATAVLILLGEANSQAEAFGIVKSSRSIAQVQEAHWPFIDKALKFLRNGNSFLPSFQ